MQERQAEAMLTVYAHDQHEYPTKASEGAIICCRTKGSSRRYDMPDDRPWIVMEEGLEGIRYVVSSEDGTWVKSSFDEWLCVLPSYIEKIHIFAEPEMAKKLALYIVGGRGLNARLG